MVRLTRSRASKLGHVHINMTRLSSGQVEHRSLGENDGIHDVRPMLIFLSVSALVVLRHPTSGPHDAHACCEGQRLTPLYTRVPC